VSPIVNSYASIDCEGASHASPLANLNHLYIPGSESLARTLLVARWEDC
jgi:hypothetical protein